jgi:hypothetical protein
MAVGALGYLLALRMTPGVADDRVDVGGLTELIQVNAAA